MAKIPYKKVADETSFENTFEDGTYLAELDKIYLANEKFGDVINVQWRILKPEGYKGRLKWENFNIGSSLPEIRERALTSFNKFWGQLVENFPGGEIDTDRDFYKVLRKKAHLKIKNYKGKDGVLRAQIVQRTPAELTPFAPSSPQGAASPPPAWDDEMPF